MKGAALDGGAVNPAAAEVSDDQVFDVVAGPVAAIDAQAFIIVILAIQDKLIAGAAAVAAVRPTLSVPGAPVSAKQVDSAIEALRGQLTGTYDVVWAITEDLRTVTLLDATGSWHVTAALATLDDLLREGRGALSERERTIFTEFVLGGVAEELGARLTQAEQLVGDMKTSLRSIRTQQGIGLTVGVLAWDWRANANRSLALGLGLITTNQGPVHLYRNDQSSGNRSVRFRLTGTKSNRDAVGATVRIFYGGESSSRMVKGGSSYLSQSELPVTFGVGRRERIDRVVLNWPSGRTDSSRTARSRCRRSRPSSPTSSPWPVPDSFLKSFKPAAP